MKIATLTLIKDEQEYLKDFIEYHLSLGINKIFFIEDIDSASHRGITDLYDDAVLIKATDIISESKILPLKLKGTGFQTLYDFVVENDVPQPQKFHTFVLQRTGYSNWLKTFQHIGKNKKPRNKLNRGGGRPIL
jgi:hypothetical protein